MSDLIVAYARLDGTNISPGGELENSLDTLAEFKDFWDGLEHLFVRVVADTGSPFWLTTADGSGGEELSRAAASVNSKPIRLQRGLCSDSVQLKFTKPSVALYCGMAPNSSNTIIGFASVHEYRLREDLRWWLNPLLSKLAEAHISCC